MAEQIGGRGQSVRRGTPDVAPAVAVTIGRVGEIGRRQHLQLADGAGPGAAQHPAGYVALAEDLQARHQLTVGPGSAAAEGGQSGQGADDVHVAGLGAEPALHGPDGDQDLPRHAPHLLDGLHLRDRLHLLSADGDALVADRAANVVPHGPRELRLSGVEGQHAGIGRQAGEGAVKHRPRDARRHGLGVKAVQPVDEIALAGGAEEIGRLRRGGGGLLGDRGSGETRGRQGEEDSAIHGLKVGANLEHRHAAPIRRGRLRPAGRPN